MRCTVRPWASVTIGSSGTSLCVSTPCKTDRIRARGQTFTGSGQAFTCRRLADFRSYERAGYQGCVCGAGCSFCFSCARVGSITTKMRSSFYSRVKAHARLHIRATTHAHVCAPHAHVCAATVRGGARHRLAQMHAAAIWSLFMFPNPDPCIGAVEKKPTLRLSTSAKIQQVEVGPDPKPRGEGFTVFVSQNASKLLYRT